MFVVNKLSHLVKTNQFTWCRKNVNEVGGGGGEGQTTFNLPLVNGEEKQAKNRCLSCVGNQLDSFWN